VAPGTRPDTNAGLGPGDDVRLASRHQQGGANRLLGSRPAASADEQSRRRREPLRVARRRCFRPNSGVRFCGAAPGRSHSPRAVVRTVSERTSATATTGWPARRRFGPGRESRNWRRAGFRGALARHLLHRKRGTRIRRRRPCSVRSEGGIFGGWNRALEASGTPRRDNPSTAVGHLCSFGAGAQLDHVRARASGSGPV
jgi:hypothetical protein